MSAGQEFVKKIGPFGSILFLIVLVGFFIYCFTLRPKNPIEGYTAPHDSSYYAQSTESLNELQTELEENVFPHLNGILSDEIEDGKLVIAISEENFVDSRNAILKYYDESLFYFERG